MRLFSSIALLLTVVAPAASQSPPRCDDPKYRQLDFWVGDWNVTSSGKRAGTNLVTQEESGCLVHEHWTGAGGGTGQSFNFYDRSDGLWHQVWVSSSGMTLFLSGQYADGKLVYSGIAPGPQGAPQQQRLTFFRNADGTVRQLWESRSDGKQWQSVFDGLYVRKTR
jgi:hypothetical protein